MTFFSSIQAPFISCSAKIIYRAVDLLPWLNMKQAADGDIGGSESTAIFEDENDIDVLCPDGSTIRDGITEPMPDDVSLTEQITGIAHGLSQACRDSESDFLHLGERLNDVNREARELTQTVVTMLGTDQKQNIQKALQNIQQHATDAVRELNERRNLLLADLQELQVIRNDLSGLNTHNRNFRQVAKNLKMVGLNISIESARSAEAKAHFQALAEEIVHLAQTVNSVAGNISDDTNAAQQNMEKIEIEISSKLDHLNGLIRSAEEAVVQALEDVEELLQMSVAAIDDVGTKADEISRQVGKLVVSIQIHDNISQRVAHMNTAFEETVHLIQASTMVDLPSSALRAVFGKAYGIIRLQIAQLHIIIEDVGMVHDKCVDALERLESAVKAVADPQHFSFSNDSESEGSEGNECREPIMILDAALSKLTALFDQGLQDIELLNEARRQTGQTIAQMDNHIEKVRDINYDIHLKALNAVVKSMRLGSTGRSIESLVIEMKELAERSNATIEASMTIMEKITSASDRMDEKDRNQDNDEKTAERQLYRCINDFHEGCTTFKAKSREALGIGCDIQEKTMETRSGLDFFDRLLSVFRYHLTELEQLVSILHSYADDVQDDWKDEEKNILDRYTMKREREAHQRLYTTADKDEMGIKNPFSKVVGEPETSMEEVTSDDEFDDNVELF